MHSSSAVLVNDVHSRLNRTRVRRVDRPEDVEQVALTVREAAGEGLSVAVCGGRHAMGGQQFGTDRALIDITGLDGVGELDAARRTIDLGAGLSWRAIIEATRRLQPDTDRPLSIRQKQTGADDLTLGGSLSANAHGRGLKLAPIVNDVESFTLVTPDSEIVRCSRTENAELFRHAIGGYGLFGVITSVRLRLQPLTNLRRHVELTNIEDVMPRLGEIETWDARYGDFQFALHDDKSNDFLRRGVLSVYVPTDETPDADTNVGLSREQWVGLLSLAHTNKREAFERYAEHYLRTHGQVYHSDTHQLSTYVPDYAEVLESQLGPREPDQSLMITELYAPPERLCGLLGRARAILRERRADPIYGTIRLIARDCDTALPWARETFACVIFNLVVQHSELGIAEARETFARLIDAAIAEHGSFFLTYHRWASIEQIRACYPTFDDFLRAKREHDPKGVFRSDWYDHYAAAASGA